MLTCVRSTPDWLREKICKEHFHSFHYFDPFPLIPWTPNVGFDGLALPWWTPPELPVPSKNYLINPPFRKPVMQLSLIKAVMAWLYSDSDLAVLLPDWCLKGLSAEVRSALI